MRIIFCFAIGTIVLSCNSNTQEQGKALRKIELNFQIDDITLETEETINLKYYRANSKDTLLLISKDNLVELPDYDSTVQYFSIEWRDYPIEFYGDFLKYELPNLLNGDVEKWYLRFDTAPFDAEKVEDPELIDRFFQVHVDSTRYTGVWTRFLKN